MKKMRIADQWVGPGEKTFVVAEAGSNHDRKLDQAKRLIDAAAESGADAVKFQLFKAEFLYAKNDPRQVLVRDFELPREWLDDLAGHARGRGILFLATPFDREAVDLLVRLQSPAIKWASPEILDLPLLRYAASKGRPILLSTGMCNLGMVHAAVEAVRAGGLDDFAVLHCVSLYPTPARHANLRMMDTLREAFQVPVGFSDHTLGIAVPVAAVARGANVIEKHFTLSRNLKGPDHSYAAEPQELKAMVQAIRDAEESLGSPVKDFVRGAEDPSLNRKGIFSARAIPKGARLSAEMLTVKRSPHGVLPSLWEAVVGRQAKQEIAEDMPITWEALS